MHPELFLDHWGKPLFTLLASPFAQFGFVGIKFFNLILASLCIFFAYKTAKIINDKTAWLTPIVLMTSTMFVTLTFSGLTEHLFAFISILGAFFFLKRKLWLSIIIISFLPFVRSEGLIIIAIFGSVLLLQKNWRLIPLLLFGHIIYSIIGAFHYSDLLWVFNKIPYASTNSPYGNGSAFHFIDQLNYVIGLPNYILLCIGLINSALYFYRKKNSLITIIIIIGLPMAFIIAHSIFWYFGIFNSMGLKRVLIDILPFIAIISSFSIYPLFVNNFKNGKWKVYACLVLVSILFLFHITPNNSSINWNKHLDLMPDQKCIVSMYKEGKLPLENKKYLFNHPYLCEVLNLDPFDPIRSGVLKAENLNNSDSVIIIWDNWFSVVQGNTSKELLNKLADYRSGHFCKIDETQVEIGIYEK